jgi:hypothetical protein
MQKVVKTEMIEDLEVKTVKGKFKILRVLKYHEINIYIRQVDEDCFEYLVPINGEVYASYMIFTPQKGRKTLTKQQIHAAEQMIVSGAMATIDAVLGIEQSPIEKAKAEEFLKVGEQAFGDKEPEVKENGSVTTN